MHERQVSTTDPSAKALTPIYRLYGHDDAVVCLHADTNLDVLLSGSMSSTSSLVALTYTQAPTAL